MEVPIWCQSAQGCFHRYMLVNKVKDLSQTLDKPAQLEPPLGSWPVTKKQKKNCCNVLDEVSDFQQNPIPQWSQWLWINVWNLADKVNLTSQTQPPKKNMKMKLLNSKNSLTLYESNSKDLSKDNQTKWIYIYRLI